MIDDRVTRGTEEAHRLLLLHDNADLRLTKPGYEIGWIPRGGTAGLSPKNRRSSGRWHGEKDEGETGSGGSAGPAGVRIQRMKQRRRSGPVDQTARTGGPGDQIAVGWRKPLRERPVPGRRGDALLAPFQREEPDFAISPFSPGNEGRRLVPLLAAGPAPLIFRRTIKASRHGTKKDCRLSVNSPSESFHPVTSVPPATRTGIPARRRRAGFAPASAPCRS